MAQGNLNMEIQFLPGVGPKRASLLQKELGIKTLEDLLRLYPFRYIDRSSFVRIADARPDMAMIQIKATVRRVDLYGSSASKDAVIITEGLKFNTIRRMSVWVSDGSGTSGGNVHYNYLFTYPGSAKNGERITFYPHSGNLSFCYKAITLTVLLNEHLII